jgi:hypothetical protein
VCSQRDRRRIIVRIIRGFRAMLMSYLSSRRAGACRPRARAAAAAADSPQATAHGQVL